MSGPTIQTSSKLRSRTRHFPELVQDRYELYRVSERERLAHVARKDRGETGGEALGSQDDYECKRIDI
jgi:hypothetical protein